MPKAAQTPAAPAVTPAPPKKTKAEKLATDTLRDTRRIHAAAKDYQEAMMGGEGGADAAALKAYIQHTFAAASAANHMAGLL